MRRSIWLALSLLFPSCSSTPESEHAAGAGEEGALFELELDARAGTLALVLPAPAGDGVVGEYLYVASFTGGMGSNPVGIDRGSSTDTQLVRFRRLGARLFVERANLRYRASSEEEAERRAVGDSFARSLIWAGALEELADGRLRVDFTSFFVRDAGEAARTLELSGEGAWTLDPERSALDPSEVHAFPDNLEVDAWLTWTGASPGPEARAVVPEPAVLTLVLHHSLVRLPDDGYSPRDYDPRSGAIDVAYVDYSARLDQPVERRLAVRHRLRKDDAREPIVYYVDRGAPEPIRSALVEGASWWTAAFEAAGFPDSFRVELLPDGVHPLDARYNVIQWVHRATRGWSYGGGVVDPRTGEMIKGHVRLGSLRIRQDRLLFEGLFGIARTGSGAPDDPIELALARIRQLAAHEVGHTLGLAHNFAASTYGGRASVMDYPAPLVTVGADGALDASRAYTVGVGEWDVQAIRWLYAQFAPEADERAELDAIVDDGIARGRIYLSDEDARPPGAAEPRANLWDNGADPVQALEEALQVRALALARFGRGNLMQGEPLSRLEEVLAPLYLHHRYALTAAAKKIGGATYAYSVNGDANADVQPVPAGEQRAALALVAALLEPRHYVLDAELLALLSPLPPGVSGGERFAGRTLPLFDPIAAAESAAALAIDELLQRERCARLVDFHVRDAELPALEEVLAAGTAAAFAGASSPDPREREIARAVRALWVERLIELATDARAASGVRFRAEAHLDEVGSAIGLSFLPSNEPAEYASLKTLTTRLQRFRDRRLDDLAVPTAPSDVPPGSPIGLAPELHGCSHGG